MPVINIEYDDSQISEEDVLRLSNAIRDIVSNVTHIEDVFVYANTAKIKVKVAPIEIFVKMSDWKIKDQDVLMNEIKTRLKEWKETNNFQYLINLTLIPMNWKIEIGI